MECDCPISYDKQIQAINKKTLLSLPSVLYQQLFTHKCTLPMFLIKKM